MDICYIGNWATAAEYIYHSEYFNLRQIICEKIDDNLLTFSLVRNIPIVQVNNADEIVSALCEGSVKFCIMCSFGKRIPMEKITNKEIYNIHFAQLPHYKGRHPTFWATVNDEKSIGISIHKITEQIDCGEVVKQFSVPYYIWMNEDSLFETLSMKIPDLIDALALKMSLSKREQLNSASITYYPPVKPADFTVDMKNDSACLIYNKVRAQSKYAGALFVFDECRFYVKEMIFTKRLSQAPFQILNNELFIKYNNDICIKSKCFKEANV